MDGYSQLFAYSERTFADSSKGTSDNDIFHSFRLYPDIFGFIHNGNLPPDREAVNIAQRIDPVLYDRYLEKNASKLMLGYGNIPDALRYNELDSRHIMMSILLFKHLPQPVETVVEIGGGYGNWLWLNRGMQSFKHWTIIDLPHINRLQEWYLRMQCVPSETYSIVSADTITSSRYDLAIGSHSLSEFSIDVFCRYVALVLVHSKYLFYANHVSRPTPQLIQEKETILSALFETIVETTSENGQVMNRLMKNRLF